MKYKTIMADPPWPMPKTGRQTSRSRKHKEKYIASSGRVVDPAWWNSATGKRVALPYSTMTIKEISEMQIKDLIEKDAHLYLWTTNRFIEEAYQVARAWGFKPSTLLQWCKPPMGIGFGGTFCNATEFILFCRRGSLKAKRRIDRTWWTWSRPYKNGAIAHSAKPEAFQDIVESVSPGPYLELFARRHRLGWHSWGNEIKSHVEF